MPSMNLSRTTLTSKLLSAFLLCFSLLLTAIPWLGGKWSANLELLALGGFYVIVADLLMLLWHAVLRKRLLIIIDAIALLLALCPLVAHYPLGTNKGRDGLNSELTVVSWNVGNFSLDLHCLDELAYVMQTVVPDIICIQERPHQNLMSKEVIVSHFPDYPYVACNDREDEVLNLMVLSKYPLTNVKNAYFPKSYNKYLSVDVDVDGKKLRLYNVHSQTTSVSDNASSSFIDKLKLVIYNAEIRNQQADQIYNDIENEKDNSVIVCGDFNSPLFSYSCQTVARGMSDAAWQSPLLLAVSSFLKAPFLPKIDHIFYKGAVMCDGYSLSEGGWTDHKMQKGHFLL